MAEDFETGFGHDNRAPNRIDREIGVRAARQHNVLRYCDLREIGLSKRQIGYRLSTRRLVPRHPEVYTLTPKVTQLGAWAAAVYACGVKAALSEQSGGQFQGIVKGYKGPIVVTVGRRDRPKIKGLRTRTTAWGPHDVVTRQNIRVTSLPRTVADLAASMSLKELARVIERALERGMRLDHLEQQVNNRKVKGAKKLRFLIARYRNAQGRTRGDFERDFYSWFDGWLPPGFPRPDRNVLVDLGDGEKREADLLFRDPKIWIELEFFDHHGASRVQTTEDRQRERAIARTEYKRVTFTSDEFEDQRDKVAADLRRLLGL